MDVNSEGSAINSLFFVNDQLISKSNYAILHHIIKVTGGEKRD